MKKNLLPPAIALLAGGVGLGLRKWQLAAGFESETGLAIPGAPSAAALAVWSCLVAAVLAILLWRRAPMPQQVEGAFPARGKTLFLTACVLGGFLLLVGCGAEVVALSASGWDLPESPASLTTAKGVLLTAWANLLPLARLILGALGCLCALVWTGGLARGNGRSHESLAILGLGLFFCVWLISDFRTRTIDPVVQNYLYEELAIVFGLMGLYCLAEYSFQAGKPRRTAWFCLLGAYFSLVTLADGHSLANVCRYGFIILFLTAHAVLLLTAPEETAEEKTEGNSDE